MDQKSRAATKSPGAAFERQSRALDKPLLSDMMPTRLTPSWGFWWAEDVGCREWERSSACLASQLAPRAAGVLEGLAIFQPGEEELGGKEATASRLKHSCMGWFPLSSTLGKCGLSREEEKSLQNQGGCPALPCTRAWGHQKAASSTPVKGTAFLP